MKPLLLLALMGLCTLAQAQPEPPEAVVVEQNPWQDFGDYRVLFSTFNSDFLAPETARALNLTRANDRALINIAVTRKDADGHYSLGLPAQVSGVVKNLLQQQKALQFVEVAEQQAHYYLAEIRVTNEEVLHLDITVQIDDQQLPLTVTRTFYVSR